MSHNLFSNKLLSIAAQSHRKQFFLYSVPQPVSLYTVLDFLKSPADLSSAYYWLVESGWMNQATVFFYSGIENNYRFA